MPRRVPSSFTSPLPDSARRPLATVLLFAISGGLAWAAHVAGWPREQVLIVGILAATVLLLFFSGLVLSRAVTKTRLDSWIAALVLRPMSDTPARLLFGVILALIAPVVAQIPPSEAFRKALLLAVPVSANVAGMSTPISSPPNAIAISYLAREGTGVGFQQWMIIAVPIVAILLAVTWWRLLRLYPPVRGGWRINFPEARLTKRGSAVLAIALLTFAIWVTEPWHRVPASAVAVLPVMLLFATTIITREDVNTLDWDVLILIAGGLTLGLGTFFSNTAIASMLMPVAVIAAGYTGAQLDVTSYALTIALVASLSMALPVSTPPNAMTYAGDGLSTGDFLRTAGYIGVAGAVLVVAVLAFLRPWVG